MDPKSIIAVLVIGLIAGWLASFIVGGGGGLLKYIIWGVIGSIVGGIVVPMVGLQISVGSPFVSQIIVATIGAVVVVLVARVIA